MRHTAWQAFALFVLVVTGLLGGTPGPASAQTGEPPTAFVHTNAGGLNGYELDLFHSSVGQATSTIDFDAYPGGAASCTNIIPRPFPISNPFTIGGVTFSTPGC